MYSKHSGRVAILVTALILLSVSTYGRNPVVEKTAEGTPDMALMWPNLCIVQQSAGQMVLAVSNFGALGLIYGLYSEVDCFTGLPLVACEYPKGSGNGYLYGAGIWVGAVVGTDTLVSLAYDGWIVAQEFFPEGAPGGNIVRRSTLDPDSPEYEGAISEQDFVAVYMDTFTSDVPNLVYDEIDGRPHVPLNLEVTQTSMAWSIPFAEDFVILDYSIRNLSDQPLNDIYFGLYVDGDVFEIGLGELGGFGEDLTGFIGDVGVQYGGCQWEDSINIGWIADNDGEINSTSYQPITGVIGTRFLLPAPLDGHISYNWWTSNPASALDYGPQTRANFRDLGTYGQGTPAGDRNKYFFMRNGERDFDEAYTKSITAEDSLWVFPNQAIAQDLSDGMDARYLLSIGPFSIGAGQSLPIPMAYVGGEGLHTVPSNAHDNLGRYSYYPDAYYANLDFSDFTANARHAAWVYDNPGIDTDSDGYAGEFVVCGNDTIFTTGDGIPDYRVIDTPLAPVIQLEAGVEQLTVRWNGLAIETSRDALSQIRDFEGYNVYLSSSGSANDFVLVASYDIDDYQKYVFDSDQAGWLMTDNPMTLEQVRCLYADSCMDAGFMPDVFTEESPYVMDGFADSIFVFKPVGNNTTEFGVETMIARVYPAQPYPTSLNPAQAKPSELTPEGRLKYFEYDLTISNLLADHCYLVAVTSFDYGWPSEGIPPQESPRDQNNQQACVLAAGYCCTDGFTGNIDCDSESHRDLADITTLIDFVFLTHSPLCCAAAANIDGDSEGKVNLADVLRLIDHVYLSKQPTEPCP